MPNTGELATVVDAYFALGDEGDLSQRKALVRRATELVDRATLPKKWAAFRILYGQLCEADEPVNAVAAFGDALTVFRIEEDPDPAMLCAGRIQALVSGPCAPGTADGEAAIAQLERVVDRAPMLEELLGALFGFVLLGDPAENWRKRVLYLERAAARTSREAHAGYWAKLNNDLALAYAEEPGADYAMALEKRIDRHTLVLAGLGESDAQYIETCLQLGTAYLDRAMGNFEENRVQAEEYLRRALAACAKRDDVAHEIQARILLARSLTFKKSDHRLQNIHEAFDTLERARALVAQGSDAQLQASVEKLCALAHLELLHLGEPNQLEPLVACCDAAIRGFSHPSSADERRKIHQIKAEALFDTGDVVRAKACCVDAVAEAEALVARATTRAGRLERIWGLHDSTARLALCCAKTGDLRGAIAAIDRGKALLWHRDTLDVDDAALVEQVPDGGALLLPIFAARDGAVVVVTRDAGVPRLTLVPLPALGLPRVLELQRGADPAAQLGGWLFAYTTRASRPDVFKQEIEDVGRILDDALWMPVVAVLDALGVARGAELVWFPQGGIGALPVQAAWRMRDGERAWIAQDYALRQAPALKTLVQFARVPRRVGPAVIVANPTNDLPFSELEVEWIRRTPGERRVVTGDDATTARVMEALASAGQVHFASHAYFDLDDPLASGIRLAHGARLTLAELLPHLSVRAPDTVVLSACETAVARVTQMADELLGIPVALHTHGVRSVLATQWSVDDEATALLMGQFYRERVDAGVSAAEALRRAQRWLRDLTNTQVLALLRELRDVPGAVGAQASRARTRRRGQEPDARPFAHPFYWAGFIVSGGVS